jgi:hypothetical protein
MDCNSVTCKTSRAHRHKTVNNCGCPEVRMTLTLTTVRFTWLSVDRRWGPQDPKHVPNPIPRMSARFTLIGLAHLLFDFFLGFSWDSNSQCRDFFYLAFDALRISHYLSTQYFPHQQNGTLFLNRFTPLFLSCRFYPSYQTLSFLF